MSVASRFWSRVDTSGGLFACWLWTGATDDAGYGRLSVEGRDEGAHRVAYRLANGSIPDGLLVRHRCDNPPCCNPAHLEPGTHVDNMADMASRGRASHHGGSAAGDRNGSRRHPESRPRGEAQPRHKLTAEEVAEIRRLFEARAATTYELAAQYGVSQSRVAQIVRGIAWRHVA